MATKKNLNTKKRQKRLVIQIIISILCLIGVILIFVYGTTGESFKNKLLNIWNNTVGTGSTQNASVQALTKDNTGDLLLYVMDTGNSDSIILKTPEGEAMLIDSADSDDSDKIISTLNALNIDELDVVVSTHPHADHTGSLGEIVDSKPVLEYITIKYEDSSKTYNNIEKKIQNKQIPKRELFEGDTFEVGEAKIEVLNPAKDVEYTDANEASMVFLITYKNSKFLFTGDAEEQAIASVTQKYGDKLNSDFLKVSHHGSSKATTAEFLQAVTPLCAIITVGKNNDYGHPHSEVTALLDANNVRTFRTDKSGDIAVFSDGNKVICKALA